MWLWMLLMPIYAVPRYCGEYFENKTFKTMESNRCFHSGNFAVLTDFSGPIHDFDKLFLRTCESVYILETFKRDFSTCATYLNLNYLV